MLNVSYLNKCYFCDVQFDNFTSLRVHKVKYCHKRKKLPRSCTITSETDTNSSENQSSEFETTPSTSAGVVQSNEEYDVEQFQHIEDRKRKLPSLSAITSDTDTGSSENQSSELKNTPSTSAGIVQSKEDCDVEQIQHIGDKRRKLSGSSINTLDTSTGSPGSQYSDFETTPSTSADVAQPKEDCDIGQMERIGNVTHSEYTERWLCQQFNSPGTSLERKEYNNALLSTPTGKQLPVLVPRVPFLENRVADALYECSFNPVVEIDYTKYLPEDSFDDYENNENVNSPGTSLKRKEYNNALLSTPTGKQLPFLVPRVPFTENRVTDALSECSLSPDVEIDYTKYLHEDSFDDHENNENVNSPSSVFTRPV